MHIIVENTVCTNTGDMAIFMALEKLLGQAFGSDAEIIIFDDSPELAAEKYPDYRFRHNLAAQLYPHNPHAGRRKKIKLKLTSLLSDAIVKLAGILPFDVLRSLLSAQTAADLKTYLEADLVVTTGGTYLVEHYDFSHRLAQFRLDRLLGKTLYFFTQSMGPFTQPGYQEAMRTNLAYAGLVLLRDQASHDYIQPLVSDDRHCHVLADSVFALADPALIENRKSTPQRLNRVIISVREWSFFKTRDSEEGLRDYKQAIGDFVTWLVRAHNSEVVFLSTCQGIKGYRDDSEFALQIYAGLDKDVQNNVQVDRHFHSPQELMNILQDVDLVFSTRMHMTILSLCVGTLSLPIAYEFKQVELAKRLGMSDLALDIENITFDKLKTATETCLADTARKPAIMGEVIHEYESASRAADLFQQAFPHKTNH